MSERRDSILPGPVTTSITSAFSAQGAWTIAQFMRPDRDPALFPIAILLMIGGGLAGFTDKKNSLASGYTLAGISAATFLIVNTISHAAFDTQSILTRIDLPSPGFMGLDVAAGLLIVSIFSMAGYSSASLVKNIGR